MSIEWTLSEHSVNTQWQFSEHSVNIQWTFSGHWVNIEWTFSEHWVNIECTFSEHSVNIQWTLSEHWVNIQWTLSEHSVNVHSWVSYSCSIRSATVNGEDSLCYFPSSLVAMPTLKGGAPYWKTGHGTGRKDGAGTGRDHLQWRRHGWIPRYTIRIENTSVVLKYDSVCK